MLEHRFQSSNTSAGFHSYLIRDTYKTHRFEMNQRKNNFYNYGQNATHIMIENPDSLAFLIIKSQHFITCGNPGNLLVLFSIALHTAQLQKYCVGEVEYCPSQS